MPKRIAIVMDCGSTSTRVVAVDEAGRLLAQAGQPSNFSPQKDGQPGWMVWDMDALWRKLARLSTQVCAKVRAQDIVAVTITTWGADGAPVDARGKLTYPPIAWACPRTEPVAEAITDQVSAWELFKTTGYQIISFNTLLKLIWLRENAPRSLDGAQWMMMAGLLSHRLCGELSIDYTGASTMMAMDLKNRTWALELLKLAGVDEGLFPRWVESGDTIGTVTAKASKATGIPTGVPVTAAGHDTQFAPLGSGARKSEAILSSGTWEILLARTRKYVANKAGFDGGLLIEADALPGLFQPQLLMMGSGVLEWLAKHYYADVVGTPKLYPTMIGEAKTAGPGAGGVTLIPSFVAGTGPTKRFNTLGTLLGLTINTERGQVYRAALEGLCCQLRLGIEMLEKATGFQPKGIRLVGGGSRNALWNQIRADVTGLPVTTIEQKEATVLGAAICAFVGAGIYQSVAAAQKGMKFTPHTFRPSRKARNAYQQLYADWAALLPKLKPFYVRK